MTMDENHVQLKSWTEEQLQIASQAVVPKSECTKSLSNFNNGRYRFVHTCMGSPFLIGGVDVSFQNKGGDAIAVYVILKYETVDSPPEVVYRSHKWYTLSIPYIPSFLAFREIEPLLELIFAQIESKPALKPNAILVDGNGQWHERKAGIATFVGVKTGIPSIGVGKTFYSIDGLMRKDKVHSDIQVAVKSWYEKMVIGGEHANIATRGLVLDTVSIPTSSKNEGIPSNSVVSEEASKDVPLDDALKALHYAANGIAIPMKGGTNNNNNEVLAYALVGHGGNTVSKKNASEDSRPRGPNHNYSASSLPLNCTRKGSKNPIYISVGSGISLEDAVVLCAQLSIARIPEPIREADLYGRQLVREKLAGR